jgi:hypothetical protein
MLYACACFALVLIAQLLLLLLLNLRPMSAQQFEICMQCIRVMLLLGRCLASENLMLVASQMHKLCGVCLVGWFGLQNGEHMCSF